ncbi:hypothetical protein D3C80_1824570 [compost metagenome]
MIGAMDPRDAPRGLLQRQAAIVKRCAIPREPGNDAIAGQGLQSRWRRLVQPVDQGRVQFLGRAVQIDIGPPDPTGDQHCPDVGGSAQQPVHRCILGAAQ